MAGSARSCRALYITPHTHPCHVCVLLLPARVAGGFDYLAIYRYLGCTHRAEMVRDGIYWNSSVRACVSGFFPDFFCRQRVCVCVRIANLINYFACKTNAHNCNEMSPVVGLA